MDCTIRVAKTKALISFAVTAKLICVFVFAYAKSQFSHDAAHIICIILYFKVNANEQYHPIPIKVLNGLDWKVHAAYSVSFIYVCYN